jgi:hypothetical protein
VTEPRFVVIATTGYAIGTGGAPGGARESTSYAVLDRLSGFREVWSYYRDSAHALPDAVIRSRAETHAEALNARHAA